ncbi:MtrAB system histidine kinase MtrB [Gryllotalpicola sp.]|uniref:MtrAB system histidine kinase MtrB n=1 Tax=Gryllotalpicola sp. TaxID=1932787 RepID=UPI002625499B|nr:MtrAB system histidine kinase MtrB [Gryllotalpicola sp.]
MTTPAAGQRWWRPSGWPRRLMRTWQHSLQFRAVLVTVVASGIAIVVTGVLISFSVERDLYQSRLDQALADAARTQQEVQQAMDAADPTDPAAVRQLDLGVRSVVATTTSAPLALFRAPGQQPNPNAPQDLISDQLPPISPELRSAVAANPTRLMSQSVALPVGDQPSTTHPGIVVGTEVDLPGAGLYELYLGYDLADSEQTLAFVQRTLLLAGLALILLIAVLADVVVRFVIGPIRLAAETSQKLAAGDLAVRIPDAGEDVFSTLARSFNGMADSLQRQITQLATLSRLQQRFVSDVSHELRTPLTTIRLASDMIHDQRGAFPAATARTAELLHTQVGRFDDLLSDLLEISRYDAGSVNLEIDQTNPVRLAEEVIDDLSGLAKANGTELRLHAPGGYFAVPMDPRRIRRVVRNLVGNAIEHGEGRPVDITVDSDENAVAIAVRDHGIGIAEADLEHVFDRFWRADPARKRTLGGTGLGLAISLEDATVHGGTLDVWSRPGEGALFRLTLPRTLGGAVEGSPIPLVPDDAGDSA